MGMELRMLAYPSANPERPDAWDEVVHAHAGLVFGTCRRVLGDDDAAADAAQDVFVRWWQQRHRIHGHLAGWLHATAHHVAVDQVRARRSRRQREIQVESSEAQAAEGDPWAPLLPHLDTALSKLPRRQRELLIEHHGRGKGQCELAREQACTQATISRQLSEARERLMCALAEHVGVVLAAGLAGLLGEVTAEEPVLWPGSGHPPLRPVPAPAPIPGPVIPGWGWVAGGLGTAALCSVLVVLLLASPGVNAGRSLPATTALVVGSVSSSTTTLTSNANHPTTNEDGAAKWQAWRQRWGSLPWKDPVAGQWRQAPVPEQVRQQAQAWLTTVEPALRELMLLAKEGEPVFGPAPVVADALAQRPDARDAAAYRAWIGKLNAATLERMIPVMGAAHALAWQAVLADDPGSRQSDLEHLLAGWSRGGGSLMLDVHGQAQLERVRDGLRMREAVASQASSASIRDWAFQDPSILATAGGAIRGEADIMLPKVSADQGGWYGTYGDSLRDLGSFLSGARDKERLGRIQAADVALRGSPVTGKNLPMSNLMVESALQERMYQVRARAAALLATAPSLPETMDSAIAGTPWASEALRGSQQGFRLQYQKLDDQRFRIGVDLDGPAPTFGDGLLKGWKPWQGLPPGSADVLERPEYIEIRRGGTSTDTVVPPFGSG